MTGFTVNVISEKEDKRVPIAVAGQVMVDIQDLFRHIGEYLISKEMRLQEAVPSALGDKFTIYMDRSGGIVLDASTYTPETVGYGNVVDDALLMLEATLDSLGSGTGGYWVDDNFKDAIYRNQVVIDIVALYQDLNDRDGYALMYGSGQELKKFGSVNVEKMANFISERGMSVNGVTIGVIDNMGSRPGSSRFTLNNGSDTVRLTFADPKIASDLSKGPYIVAGKVNYSEEGKISSVENVHEMVPLTAIRYRRIISSNGDVTLKVPVDVEVTFKDGKWVLSNKDLGILSSKARWDDAVADFHDYFVFLWTEYKMKTSDDISDEEKEVRDALNALVSE